MEWLFMDGGITLPNDPNCLKCGVRQRKLQLSHVVKKLFEPCTEHRSERVKGWSKNEPEVVDKFFTPYRKDCPACMESIKQEAGIE